MSTDLIRYDVLVQQALRGVVRKVVTDGARDGLPGSHHFYISFDTRAPNVKMSPRLRGMYPDEMTIVLQHQFWDLSVSETGFEVSLSFDKAPERLGVPFEAITGFFDPSVKFGLKFEAVTDEAKSADAAPAKPAKKPARPKLAEASDDPVPIGKRTRPGKEPVKEPQDLAPAASTPAAKEAPADDKAAKAAAESAKAPAPAKEEPKESGAAEVISLDAFRKKK